VSRAYNSPHEVKGEAVVLISFKLCLRYCNDPDQAKEASTSLTEKTVSFDVAFIMTCTSKIMK
jgi:hypothetical protein